VRGLEVIPGTGFGFETVLHSSGGGSIIALTEYAPEVRVVTPADLWETQLELKDGVRISALDLK